MEVAFVEYRYVVVGSWERGGWWKDPRGMEEVSECSEFQEAPDSGG
jgi:hypothetical protein